MGETVETPISPQNPEQDKENEEEQEDLAGDKITSDIEQDPTDEELDLDTADSTSEDEMTSADEIPSTFEADATYTVNFKAGTGYTFANDNTNSATAGTDFTFTVSLAEGYKDLQVKAYVGDDATNGEQVTVEALTEGSESGTYTGTIKGETLTNLTATDGKTITVEASATEIPKYTLTLPKASDIPGISKVEYSENATDWTEASDAAPAFAENTDVYVKVTPDADYNYTVKKQYTGDSEASDAAKEQGQDYYKFTMTANLTLTITATAVATSYDVTVTGADMAGTEGTNEAELTWANDDVTVTDDKITVAAGKDLKFKLAVKEASADTKKIKSVTYQIGSNAAETITPDAEGVYTISSTVITDTVTIAVTTAAFEDYTLTFNYDDTKIAAPEIKVNGAALAADKWDENTKTATISEKDSVSFTLSPAENSKYVVDKVTIDDTVLDPEEDGSYLLGQLTENTVVEVTEKLDEEQANRLTLATADGGNARGYSVTFKQGGQNDFDIEEKSFKNGEKIVTLSTSFYALITPGKGFHLESAEGTADGVTVTKVEGQDIPGTITVGEGELLYKIAYAKAAALDLKVKATATASETEQTVLFSNRSARLTYKLTDENIKQAENKKNTYVVPKGSTSFDFTVDAAIGYQPTASYLDENTQRVDVDFVGEGVLTSNKKAKTFTYSLAVGELPDNTVITLEDTADTQNVKITLDSDEVDITDVRIGAREYTDDLDWADNVDGTGTATIPVPHGETLTITVAANDNCEIIKTVTNTGSSPKTDTKVKTSFEASFKADATKDVDQTLVIESRSNYVGVLQDTTSGTKPLDPVKSVYTVDYNHTYTVKADCGVNSAVALNSVDVKAKKDGAAIEGVTATLAGDSKSASFTINDKALAAKDLVVELHAKNGNAEKADVTLALSVRPVLDKVTVTGVKNGELTQTVDTTKEYAVTLNPKTATNAELHAVVDPAVEGVSAVYSAKTGKLSVTTSQTLDTAATIKLYTLTAGTEDNAENRTYIAKDNGGEFTVKSVAQIAANTKPTVKLASSDDRTLTLTLSAPKTIVDASKGTVLYKVTIKSNGAAAGTKDAVTAQTNVEAALTANGKTFYVPKKKDALSQNETFTVTNAAKGAGDAWKYDVSVSLMQAKEPIRNNEATIATVIGVESDAVTTGTKPFETKAPYFEDKLKLKKGTTTIYTGQQESADKKGNVDTNGVLIATAQFGKNTTHTEIVDVVDLTYPDGGTGDEGGLALTIDEDKIYATAYTSEANLGDMFSAYTALGKHKIAVYAKADTGMQQSMATVDVTVVEGIEKLKVNVPTTSLYKTDKKAASFKAAVEYNPGFAKAFAAKTKKVTWSIVDADYGEISEYSPLQFVTVKNGTVNVDAKFVVSDDESDNQFRVMAAAADYYGNDDFVFAYSDVITITEKPQEIGDLVLAKYVEDVNGGDGSYEVLARNGDSVTAKELTDAQLFVLRRGTPEKAFTWDDTLDARAFDFKSGNKAVVLTPQDGIDENDNPFRDIHVSVNKPANKVKLTATANDGSKQKAEMTINVNYDTVSDGELGLRIHTEAPSYMENNPSDETEVLSFDGATSTPYYVAVVKKNGNSWEEISDYTDFKVTAKNAKFIADGAYSEQMTFVNTSVKTAEITLTYSVPKATGKGFEKKTRTYKVTNTGYQAGKAPKITLSGSLIAGYNDDAQTITGKVTPDRSMPEDIFKRKEVNVELDWTKVTSKNWEDYTSLSRQLRDAYVDGETGALTLRFASTGTNEDGEAITYTDIPAGSYNLKITFGTRNMDADTPYGEFVPDCQAASVTLKVAARKVQKGSYKPTASYTLSLLDSSVELTGKGSNVNNVAFGTTLKNDNIKGVTNHFSDYFEVYEDTTDPENPKYYLQLKNSKMEEELAKSANEGKALSEIIPKDDLTGYVSYTASVGADQYGYPTEIKDTVKLTVKLKDKTATKDDSVVKYAATNASVLGGLAGATAKIQITADKKPAKIAYAYALKKGSESEKDAFDVADADGGSVVTLTSTNIPANGAHDIDLYVIPEGTYWDNFISSMQKEGNEADDAFAARKNAVIKAHGVKLTVKVTVEDPAAKTGKIKVSSTNIVFTNDQYADNGSGNYWVDVPYTKVLDCEIDEITVDSSNTSLIKDIIHFDTDEIQEEGTATVNYIIRACINKDELKKAIADSNNSLKWEQKNINIKTTVAFKNGVVDEVDYGAEKKAESITFKVTLPKEPVVQKTFAEIVEEVKGATDDIMDVKLPDDWNALNSEDTDADGYTELQYVCNDVKWQIYNNIKGLAPADSDVLIQLGGDDVDKGYTYVAATIAVEGSLTVPVTLVDLTTAVEIKDNDGNGTGEYNLENADKVVLEEATGGYKFVIPKKSLDADDATVTNQIETLMTDLNDSSDITVSNATTAADIRAYLLKGAESVLGTDLTLWVQITDVEGEEGFTKATDNAAGKIIVNVIVQNKKGGKPFEKVYNTKAGGEAYVKIPKLLTAEEVAAAIKTALETPGQFKASNNTTKEEVEAAIQEVIDEKNPDVTFEWAKKTDSEEDDYTLTAARIPHDADGDTEADTGEGSIVGKIVLKNENSAAGVADSECSFNIPIDPLKKSDEAIAAVKAAAIGETNAKKFAESNVEATVKEAVLTAARAAVKDDPYVVDFKKDATDSTKDVFEFTEVKWDTAGSISYTLEVRVKNADGTAGDVVTDTNNDLVQAAVELTADPSLIKAVEAKAVIAGELSKEGVTWTVANTDTEAEALAKVQTQLTSYLAAGTGITVTVTKVSFQAATVKEKGELVCSWTVTKGEDEPLPGDENITIAIEKIAQTKAEAAAAAKTAGEKVAVTNEAFATTEATTAKQEEIVKAVTDAVADTFTVEVKADLTRSKEPTINEAGAASIAFSIKEGEEDSSAETATCSYTLPALDQTLDAAVTAAEGAVEAYRETASNTSSNDENAILNAVKAAIKTSKFDAAWSTEEGKGFKKTDSAAAAEGGEATPGSITGEIVITETGTTNTQTVTVNITWEHTA